MITLNLLPSNKKKQLKNQRLYSAIKEAVVLIILFTSIIAIMLWVSRYYLEKQLADLIVTNSLQLKSQEQTALKIQTINNKLKTIDNLQKNRYHLGQLIQQLTTITPASISYNQIRFFFQQKTIELSGTAKTRNDLLSLKNSLETTKWIKKINLPMDNLVNKENNQFQITIELNEPDI